MTAAERVAELAKRDRDAAGRIVAALEAAGDATFGNDIDAAGRYSALFRAFTPEERDLFKACIADILAESDRMRAEASQP